MVVVEKVFRFEIGVQIAARLKFASNDPLHCSRGSQEKFSAVVHQDLGLFVYSVKSKGQKLVSGIVPGEVRGGEKGSSHGSALCNIRMKLR